MEKVMEFFKLCLLYLWQENGGSVISTAIATILSMCAQMDWAKRSKGFFLFVWFLQITLNIPCVFFSDAAWYERAYGGMLMIYGAVKFYETMKIKVPRKTVLSMDELGYPGQTVEFDDKKMFLEAQKGAAEGIPMYICNLGYFYRDGRGTRMNLSKSKYYFEQLCRHPDPFWQEEGRRNLQEVEKLIAERNEKIRDAARDGAQSMAEDFFGIETD